MSTFPDRSSTSEDALVWLVATPDRLAVRSGAPDHRRSGRSVAARAAPASNTPEIEPNLQEHPQLSRTARVFLKTDSEFRRNGSIPSDDAVKGLSGDAQITGRLAYGCAESRKDARREEITGMDGLCGLLVGRLGGRDRASGNVVHVDNPTQ